MSTKHSLIIYTLHNAFYFNVERICQSCLKGYVLLNTSMYVRESRGRNMNEPRCLSYISRFYANCWTKYSASLSLSNFVSFTRVTTLKIQDWNSLNSIVPNNKLWNTYWTFLVIVSADFVNVVYTARHCVRISEFMFLLVYLIRPTTVCATVFCCADLLDKQQNKSFTFVKVLKIEILV